MAIGKTPSNAYNIFMPFDRMLGCEDWSNACITIAQWVVKDLNKVQLD